MSVYKKFGKIIALVLPYTKCELFKNSILQIKNFVFSFEWITFYLEFYLDFSEDNLANKMTPWLWV